MQCFSLKLKKTMKFWWVMICNKNTRCVAICNELMDVSDFYSLLDISVFFSRAHCQATWNDGTMECWNTGYEKLNP